MPPAMPQKAVQLVMESYQPPPDRYRQLTLAERDPTSLTKAQKKRLRKKLKQQQKGAAGDAPAGEDGDEEEEEEAEAKKGEAEVPKKEVKAGHEKAAAPAVCGGNGLHNRGAGGQVHWGALTPLLNFAPLYIVSNKNENEGRI